MLTEPILQSVVGGECKTIELLFLDPAWREANQAEFGGGPDWLSETLHDVSNPYMSELISQLVSLSTFVSTKPFWERRGESLLDHALVEQSVLQIVVEIADTSTSPAWRGECADEDGVFVEGHDGE